MYPYSQAGARGGIGSGDSDGGRTLPKVEKKTTGADSPLEAWSVSEARTRTRLFVMSLVSPQHAGIQPQLARRRTATRLHLGPSACGPSASHGVAAAVDLSAAVGLTARPPPLMGTGGQGSAHARVRANGGADVASSVSDPTSQLAFPTKPCTNPNTVLQYAEAVAAHVTADFRDLRHLVSEEDRLQRSTDSAVLERRHGSASCPTGSTDVVDPQHLQLEKDVDVQCVSTLGHARKAIKKLLSTKWKATAIPGHGVVGIDTEWQPKTRNPTAILQAATLSHVFLFDLPALHERYPKQWPVLARRLLLARNVIKTGYGLHGDLDRLAATYPDTTCYRCARMVMDTAELWRHQFGSLPSATVYTTLGTRRRRRCRGLALLVRHALRIDLDKSQQCSDWDCRPWTPAQVQYAALDAHVLLQLFRVATQKPSSVSAQPWATRCETFHFYDPCVPLRELPVPPSLSSRLAEDGTVVPSSATYLRAPHALLSMADAVSFLTRLYSHPEAKPIPPERLLSHLVKTIALVVEMSPAGPSGSGSGPGLKPAQGATAVPSHVLPVLAITAGNLQVDPQLVLRAVRGMESSALDGVPPSCTSVRKARFAECASLFGYEAGHIAPFARSRRVVSPGAGGIGDDSTTPAPCVLPALVVVDTSLDTMVDSTSSEDTDDGSCGESPFSKTSVYAHCAGRSCDRFCGVGLPDVLLRLPASDLVVMSRGTVARVSAPPAGMGVENTTVVAPSKVQTRRQPKSQTQRQSKRQSKRQPTLRPTPQSAHQPAPQSTRSPAKRSPAKRSPTHPSGESGESGEAAAPRPAASGLDVSLRALDTTRKAGWGRRHVNVSLPSLSSAGLVTTTRGGSNIAGGTTRQGAAVDAAANAAALAGVATVLARNGYHACPIFMRMWQIHLAVAYGPHANLPNAPRLLTDYLTRSQLFLCNALGNYTLRVLSFIAYKCHHRVPNLAFCLRMANAWGVGEGMKVRQQTFETASIAVLGATWETCKTRDALQSCHLGVPSVGAPCAPLTAAATSEDGHACGEEHRVLALLGERDKLFLSRIAHAVWRCHKEVAATLSSHPTTTTDVPRMLVAYSILQDVARAGNMYVQHVVGDFTKGRQGSFWHVLSCIAIAYTSVELVTDLLCRGLPVFGRMLYQQLAHDDNPQPTLLSVHDIIRVAEACAADASAPTATHTIAPEAPASASPTNAPSVPDEAEHAALVELVRHTVSRAGRVIGNPSPLFRHVGRRRGQHLVKDAWAVVRKASGKAMG